MTETTEPTNDDLSRRTVLRKTTTASGTLLLGGAALTGTASAIDDGFGYVPDNVDVEKTGSVTLKERTGTERVECAFRGDSYEISTEAFKVKEYSGQIYLAASKFEEGDQVRLLDKNYDCPTSHPASLKEVDLGTVDF